MEWVLLLFSTSLFALGTFKDDGYTLEDIPNRFSECKCGEPIISHGAEVIYERTSDLAYEFDIPRDEWVSDNSWPHSWVALQCASNFTRSRARNCNGEVKKHTCDCNVSVYGKAQCRISVTFRHSRLWNEFPRSLLSLASSRVELVLVNKLFWFYLLWLYLLNSLCGCLDDVKVLLFISLKTVRWETPLSLLLESSHGLTCFAYSSWFLQYSM